VHPKGADSMAVLERPWFSHFSPPMHKRVEKAVLLSCRAPISSSEAVFLVWTSSCWLRAVTIVSSSKGGCGLSHRGLL